MGQEKDWPAPMDATDKFRQDTKTADIERRRPLVRKGSDLLGPLAAPHAVTIDDLDSETASFVGAMFVPAGAKNGPNTAKDWIGEVVATREEGGRQTLSTFRAADAPHETWSRVFNYIVGTTVRIYGAWEKQGSDPTATDIYTATNSTAQADVLAAHPPTSARPTFVYRSDLDQLRYTRNGIAWTYVSGADTAPVTPTMGSGWTAAGTAGVKYERNNGWVTVICDYANRTSGTGTTAFTLPVGFRPAANIPTPGWTSAGAFAQAIVGTNGAFVVFAASFTGTAHFPAIMPT